MTGRPELRVDLDAIATNWRLLRAAVAPGTAGAVVKADGYGLGALPVATRLCAEGCTDFFVATATEALTLRPHLPRSACIHVFEGAQATTAAMLADGDVVPVLNDAPQLARWRELASARGRPLPASLHIDTGMARLGFDHATIAAQLADADALQGVTVQLLMTHLACADETAHPFTATQLARFDAARALLAPRLPGLRTSIGNSAGALAGAATRGDLARPGIALYGSNPFADGRSTQLREVARLHAPILQVRAVRQGETVGYGATFVAHRDLRIATVALGYADGYLRSLGNRGWAMLAGQRVPLVGRVSMDLTAFDVTAVDPAPRPGEQLCLLGGGVDIDELARAAGTLSYELLTRIGARVQRRYVGT